MTSALVDIFTQPSQLGKVEFGLLSRGLASRKMVLRNKYYFTKNFLLPKPQLGKVEFWLAKLLARLAEQVSRSGGLSKQEKGFEK